MLSVKAIYDGKQVHLAEEIQVDREVEVIVTFLAEGLVQKELPGEPHFHFQESRELLRQLASSLSEEVIRNREER